MLFIHNIKSVARYESKILLRSWFFKVFTVLSVLFMFFLNFSWVKYPSWAMFAIPSNFPYSSMYILNIAQAIIVIFLSSEFLKRDKKLDTSEVFYVRPLSNTEYVLGKVWGNLKVFFILNIIILGMVVVFNYVAQGITIDWGAYPSYFFLIGIPTLVYIMGLSIFLMLLFGSQALTFIVLLGYIGMALFYIDDKLYFLFDYMGWSLPMMKSLIIGFSNPDAMINQRLIYLFLGLGFILFSIYQFRRLPNSPRSIRPWLFLSIVMFTCAVLCGYKHLNKYYSSLKDKQIYTALNNKYVHHPKLVIKNYTIDLEQGKSDFVSVVKMQGIALKTSREFVFSLNPSLDVTEVEGARFRRDHQILIADFDRDIKAGDTVNLTIKYNGTIDESFCYLDIPDEILMMKKKQSSFNIDKRYFFQTPDYLLLTPETYWYPRPGTGYSNESLDWQQTFFSNYTLNVKPRKNLVPFSSGNIVKDSTTGIYTIATDYPMQGVALTIGNYQKKSIVVDSIEYSVLYIKGHDNFSMAFDSAFCDTLPSLLRDFKERFEKEVNLDYPFKRFSIVETPAQFTTYARGWTQAQENQYPEIVMIPEKGFNFRDFNFAHRIAEDNAWRKKQGREITMLESSINIFNGVQWYFRNKEQGGGVSVNNSRVTVVNSEPNSYYLFPQFYNFRYNVYSPEWSIANRIIELYIQNRSATGGNSWLREVTGISKEEKVNMLMEKRSLEDLLNDEELRDLYETIIATAGNRFFANAELNYGTAELRASLLEILKSSKFENIKFEGLMDTLGRLSNTDLLSNTHEWQSPIMLPQYCTTSPSIMSIIDRYEELYQIEMSISNVSHTPGIVRVEVIGIRGQDGIAPNGVPLVRMISLAAHQTKTIIDQWETRPRRYSVNTMMSGSIPSFMEHSFSNETRGRRSDRKIPGIYITDSNVFDIPGEIVVDNEDSSLFYVTTAPNTGYLTRWLGEKADTNFKYLGSSDWLSPYQWTPSTDTRFYGKAIRSGYTIRSGKGNQYAQWKIPVPEPGRYELYFYVKKPQELRFSRNNSRKYSRKRVKSECELLIGYDGSWENAYIDIAKNEDGWAQVGTYHFGADTVTVRLTDKTGLASVTADAVKLVRR